MQVVSLKDGSIRNLEEITEPGRKEIKRWDGQWEAFIRRHVRSRGPTAHWSWAAKERRHREDENQVFYALTADTRCHGLMMVRWPDASTLDPAVECMHVEYLEVAPWNRFDVVGGGREFAAIGPLLMYAAVRLSEAFGFNGRLSLHSIPSAEWFYPKIGMLMVGEVAVGPDEQMKRFEFSEEGAKAFVERHEVAQ